MKCIFCGNSESKVNDSRESSSLSSIRRRRECLNCGKRWTTFETVETRSILVAKTDGSRQAFDAQKIRRGIIKACGKRAITGEQIDNMVDNIEKQIYNSLRAEWSTTEIGEMVMDQLRVLDEVAYVRFASVYKKFDNIKDFAKFLVGEHN